MHTEIHFTTKHVRYAHMLASYMTAVQIFRLLKPHAHFVNRNNVIISSSYARIIAASLAAGHAELLALAQKIVFCECWNKLLRTYTACKLLPRGIDGSFL